MGRAAAMDEGQEPAARAHGLGPIVRDVDILHLVVAYVDDGPR